MLFMYWASGSEIGTPPAAPAWKKLYPEFRVFTDGDVQELLPPDFASTFNSIRLPSAKSDIARLLLLREYGGMYLDAHMGPTKPEFLLETLDKLSAFNIILFGQGWAMKTANDFDLMNGAIAARKNAPELDICIDLILKNTNEQRDRENSTTEYVPYNLFSLTGTYILIQSFFDQIQPRPQLKEIYMRSIFVHFMKDNHRSGFEIASHYTYRKPGNHWSERQNSERFFIT